MYLEGRGLPVPALTRHTDRRTTSACDDGGGGHRCWRRTDGATDARGPPRLIDSRHRRTLSGWRGPYDSATSFRAPVTRVPCKIVVLPTQRIWTLLLYYADSAAEQHRTESVAGPIGSDSRVWGQRAAAGGRGVGAGKQVRCCLAVCVPGPHQILRLVHSIRSPPPPPPPYTTRLCDGMEHLWANMSGYYYSDFRVVSCRTFSIKIMFVWYR